MRTLTKELQESITPFTALKLLQNGNKRFINNLKLNRDLIQQANETSHAQHPFAVILSCIDSRTAVELIFDQGIGDVFSVRIAGAIINEDILGSLEFGCKIAGAKIIVVLIHTNCGAVKGACDRLVLGNLTGIFEKIQPAMDEEITVTEHRNSQNAEFVEKVSALHVKRIVNDIVQRSSILKEMVESGSCGIIAGKHDISTGKVEFYKDTMLSFFKPKPLPILVYETSEEYKNYF